MANLVLPFLLLAAAAATPFAAANSPPADSFSPFRSGDPSIAVIVVVLVLACFLMGFIFLCIRFPVQFTSHNDDSRRFVVAASLWRASEGLDPSVIESFPVASYLEFKDRWIRDGGSIECAVCINDFVDGEMLRTLPKCNHAFHPNCIDVWLASHTSCPVCRKDQSPEPEGSIKRMEPDSGSEDIGLQNQVSITVNSDENGTERSRILYNEVKTMKISRSNSTGHSLAQLGESTEQHYTMNFPGEIRIQVAANSSQLKRTKSCDVIRPVVNGDRSGDLEKSKRWTFNVAHLSLQDRFNPGRR